MKLRIRLVLAAVLSGLFALVGVSPASAASGPPAGSGGELIAKAGVITVTHRIPLDGAMTLAATPAQSFCYVLVTWPTLLPDQRATATWSLDCRSLANPNLPAPDIAGADLQVRIFQGEFNPFDPGQMIKGTQCLSIARTNPSCSATTDSPLQFGVSYYTRLDVTVTLTGGLAPVGAFVTPAIRLV